MIDRITTPQILTALERFPAVGLIGPRQVGKTTLARQLMTTRPGAEYLDLERPSDLAQLQNPELYLQPRADRLVILDEIQQVPALFPVLRALIDQHRVPGRFLLLGSATPALINRSSESLAGRIRFIEMRPLQIAEVMHLDDALSRLWLRGGFPDSFLAGDDAASCEWREAFVRTFLERDIPALGLRLPPQALRRFWQMLAHWHGQLWNASTISRSLDTSTQTANRYLDLLCDAFVARRLPPWLANTGKRLVKSPRVYLRDSGMLHILLNLQDGRQLTGHPSVGASWEGFVIEQLLSALDPLDSGFYRTAAGAELDLVVSLRTHSSPVAFEIKHSAAPRPSRGFWNALDDLGIEQAFVVHAGDARYPLEKRVTALPARELPQLPAILGEGR